MAMGDAGELGTRLVIMPGTGSVDHAEFREEFPGYGAAGPGYRFGAAKQFYDNFVTSRTAYMYDAYPGLGEWAGEARLTLAAFRARVRMIWDLGWPLGIHATGDRALAEAGAVLAELPGASDGAGRHTIHAYYPTETALHTHARAGIAVAVQPSFLRAWGETLSTLLGPARGQAFLPLRTYLGAGVVVGGGSDAPIAAWNPFHGMATAVDRATLGGDVSAASECLTSREALLLYTRGAAATLDMSNDIGSIEPGKFADLVMVDRDVRDCTADQLRDTRVERTIVSGRVVFECRSSRPHQA